MVDFDKVERAVDYLRDSAKPAAKARGDHEFLEAALKTVKADAMKKHPDLPVTAQEREAYASLEYKAALEEFRQAATEDYNYRFLRDAADGLIRMWQTLEATKRAEGKAYGP